MIRTYDELDADMKTRLHLLLKASGNPLLPGGVADMERLYGGNAFTNGTTHWSFWRGEEPVATLGAVTEARDAKGEVYLTGICLASGAFGELDELLRGAEPVLLRWAPCRLKLGANAFVPGLPEWAEGREFTFSYRLLEMRLGANADGPEPGMRTGISEDQPDPDTRAGTDAPEAEAGCEPALAWSPVTVENAETYRRVANAAFLHSPNGGVLDPAAVRDMMAACGAHPELLSLGCSDGVPVATLTLLLEGDGSGVIDGVAVHPDAQGRGFGRAALRHAVRTLRGLGADPITLTVMDVNRPAVSLYLQEGFVVERVLSSWYEKALEGSWGNASPAGTGVTHPPRAGTCGCRSTDNPA